MNLTFNLKPTTIGLKEGHSSDKSDDRVGHLNTILAQGRGNLNDTIQVQMPLVVSS